MEVESSPEADSDISSSSAGEESSEFDVEEYRRKNTEYHNKIQERAYQQAIERRKKVADERNQQQVDDESTETTCPTTSLESTDESDVEEHRRKNTEYHEARQLVARNRAQERKAKEKTDRENAKNQEATKSSDESESDDSDNGSSSKSSKLSKGATSHPIVESKMEKLMNKNAENIPKEIWIKKLKPPPPKKLLNRVSPPTNEEVNSETKKQRGNDNEVEIATPGNLDQDISPPAQSSFMASTPYQKPGKGKGPGLTLSPVTDRNEQRHTHLIYTQKSKSQRSPVRPAATNNFNNIDDDEAAQNDPEIRNPNKQSEIRAAVPQPGKIISSGDKQTTKESQQTSTQQAPKNSTFNVTNGFFSEVPRTKRTPLHRQTGTKSPEKLNKEKIDTNERHDDNELLIPRQDAKTKPREYFRITSSTSRDDNSPPKVSSQRVFTSKKPGNPSLTRPSAVNSEQYSSDELLDIDPPHFSPTASIHNSRKVLGVTRGKSIISRKTIRRISTSSSSDEDEPVPPTKNIAPKQSVIHKRTKDSVTTTFSATPLPVIGEMTKRPVVKTQLRVSSSSARTEPPHLPTLTEMDQNVGSSNSQSTSPNKNVGRKNTLVVSGRDRDHNEAEAPVVVAEENTNSTSALRSSQHLSSVGKSRVLHTSLQSASPRKRTDIRTTPRKSGRVSIISNTSFKERIAEAVDSSESDSPVPPPRVRTKPRSQSFDASIIGSSKRMSANLDASKEHNNDHKHTSNSQSLQQHAAPRSENDQSKESQNTENVPLVLEQPSSSEDPIEGTKQAAAEPAPERKNNVNQDAREDGGAADIPANKRRKTTAVPVVGKPMTSSQRTTRSSKVVNDPHTPCPTTSKRGGKPSQAIEPEKIPEQEIGSNIDIDPPLRRVTRGMQETTAQQKRKGGAVARFPAKKSRPMSPPPLAEVISDVEKIADPTDERDVQLPLTSSRSSSSKLATVSRRSQLSQRQSMNPNPPILNQSPHQAIRNQSSENDRSKENQITENVALVLEQPSSSEDPIEGRATAGRRERPQQATKQAAAEPATAAPERKNQVAQSSTKRVTRSTKERPSESDDDKVNEQNSPSSTPAQIQSSASTNDVNQDAREDGGAADIPANKRRKTTAVPVVGKPMASSQRTTRSTKIVNDPLTARPTTSKRGGKPSQAIEPEKIPEQEIGSNIDIDPPLRRVTRGMQQTTAQQKRKGGAVVRFPAKKSRPMSPPPLAEVISDVEIIDDPAVGSQSPQEASTAPSSQVVAGTSRSQVSLSQGSNTSVSSVRSRQSRRSIFQIARLAATTQKKQKAAAPRQQIPERYIGNDVFGNYHMLKNTDFLEILQEVRPQHNLNPEQVKLLGLKINHFLEDFFVYHCNTTECPYGFVPFSQLKQGMIDQCLLPEDITTDQLLAEMKKEFSKQDWKRAEGILFPSRYSQNEDTVDYLLK